MDFVFGTLSTDSLKHIYHRAFRQGLQHRHAVASADPNPGDAVTLSAWTGVDCQLDHVVCYYTTDRTVPEGARGVGVKGHVVPFRPVAAEWDTLAWGYLTRWQATLPPQPEGTFVQYRIGGWQGDGAEVFADSPNPSDITESAAAAYFAEREWTAPTLADASGRLFAYRVDAFTPPDWAHQAMIYHLLVDRFYPGDARPWTQTEDVSQSMGGTLFGVRDKLGYLSDLGMNTLWLSPTWVSPSAHGYDVVDYRQTAAHLGGDAALRQLVDAAHQRGMRVLLDMPCNHLSNQHPIFLDALHDVSSPYRDWFTWDVPPHGYKSFFGVQTMPTLHLDTPAARDWMIDNAQYWLREFDIDGYRLDVANGPGPDFWTFFQAACRDVKHDCLCFGEVIDTPEAQMTYFGRLDGCLDFFVNENLRKTFGWKTQSMADYERQVSRHYQYFPSTFLKPTFLDNHDMNRFLHIAQGDKTALRAAFATQLQLPAPSILYYGTEIGLTHALSTGERGSEAGRVAMVWDERQDRHLLEDFAVLIRARAAVRIKRGD